MAQSTGNMITLYDISSKDGVGAWCPHGWTIRLALNFKRLPHTTVWLSYPDIEPHMKELGAEPGHTHPVRGIVYTLPVIHDPANNAIVTDSWNIAEHIDKHYPSEFQLFPKGSKMLQKVFKNWYEELIGALFSVVAMDVPANLDPRGAEYYIRTRKEIRGKPLEEWVEDRPAEWQKIRRLYGRIAQLFEEYHDSTGTGEEDPWVMGGEHPTFADFVIGGILVWTRKLVNREGEGWDVLGKSQGGKWERYLQKMAPYMQEH